MNNTNTAAAPTIANNILKQLGNRTLAMLGAHNLIDHGDALSFKFRGSRTANWLKITLSADDTYALDFKRITKRGLNVKDIYKVASVYADSMHAAIESTTGLYTSL